MNTQIFKNIHKETWSIFSTPMPQTQRFGREFVIRDTTNNRDTKLKAVLTIAKNTNAILNISLVSNEDLSSCMIRVQDLEFFDVDGERVGVPLFDFERHVSNPPQISAEGDLAAKAVVIDTLMSSLSLSKLLRLEGSFTAKFTIVSTLVWRKNYGSEDLRTTGKKHDHLHEQRVLEDFQSMLTDVDTADFKIRATLGTEKTFMCHKFILIARSPIFRAMLGSQMMERDQNITTVNDIGPGTMEHFLSFLYCGKFQVDTWVQYLPNLTYVADKYCVADLKEYCDKNLIQSVTCKNALALANLAQRHELPTALCQIRKFVEKNAGSLNFDIVSAAEGLEIGQ